MLAVLLGVIKVNVEFNREKYKASKDVVVENNKHWNLDDMVTVLDKYIIDSNNVKFLFNKKPFDFRIDTSKYVICFNKHIIKDGKENLTIAFKKSSEWLEKKVIRNIK